MIDEKKLLEALVPILDECGDMYLAGRIAGCIMAQPKISLENKTSDNMNSSCSGQVWIPVSERLPEANQMVLATEKDSVILCCYEFVDGYGYCFYGSHGEVIAWMPLPKPYEVEK